MKTRICLGVLATGIGIASLVWAQLNPRGRTETVVEGRLVSIEYGRPAIGGRDVLAEAPAPFFWRIGADRSTTFWTEATLDVGGVHLGPGAYSLFVERRVDDAWQLLFNTETGQWGTQHDRARDVAALPLRLEVTPDHVEMLTISLRPAQDGAELAIAWGAHVLRGTLTTP